jgi:hypothetical protein
MRNDQIVQRTIKTVLGHYPTVQGSYLDGDTLIYCADRFAVDEFEMLVISYYQKLNEECREILDSFIRTGRAYAIPNTIST